jgi:hypothetical protein
MVAGYGGVIDEALSTPMMVTKVVGVVVAVRAGAVTVADVVYADEAAVGTGVVGSWPV